MKDEQRASELAWGEDEAYCPSAQPTMPDSVVLGVVGGSAEDPRVSYLDDPVPTSKTLLRLAEPVEPTEVFRFAAPCAQRACMHFDGVKCKLVSRVHELLPPVTDELPPCHLRPRCVWFKQEGRAACLRCPQIVTQVHQPDPDIAAAAAPS